MLMKMDRSAASCQHRVATVRWWYYFTQGTIFTLMVFTHLLPPVSPCKGRTVLNATQGTISDGPDDYPESAHCEWLIDGEYL